MRIGIDVRYLSHNLVGGVHNYVYQLVPPLLELAAEYDIYLYADTKAPFELSSLPGHVALRLLPWRGPWSSLYHDFFLRRQIAADQLDLIHFPANYGFAPAGVASVVTVHDAINILPLREIIRGHRKAPRTIGVMTYLHLMTTAAVRRATLLLTVSAYAQREIARHSGLAFGKIVPIPHAPTTRLGGRREKAALAALRMELGLPERFVIADALKNPEVLVRAWHLLPEALRNEYRIVFFCRHADVHTSVREAVAAEQAILLVRPSDETLGALYQMAEAFVFPSWIEGFGMPVLESMAFGTPVIASDRGAIPEVAGDAALLSDAEDERSLADNIMRVLGDPMLAQSLRSRGLARAATFTWKNTARQVLRSYHMALDATHC